jgi:hypothetical protein
MQRALLAIAAAALIVAAPFAQGPRRVAKTAPKAPIPTHPPMGGSVALDARGRLDRQRAGF